MTRGPSNARDKTSTFQCSGFQCGFRYYMDQPWTEPLAVALETLCGNSGKGRITLRKNQPRWKGVVAACQRVLDVVATQPQLLVPGDSADVAVHTGKLMDFASLVCEAAANEARTTLTHTLAPGAWKIEAFRQSLDRVAAAADQDGDLASNDNDDDHAANNNNNYYNQASDQLSMATATPAQDSAGTPDETLWQRPWAQYAEATNAAEASTLDLPPPVEDVQGVPHSLVVLLDIAHVLTSESLVCEDVAVEPDGSIVLVLRNNDQSDRPLARLHRVRFLRVLAEDELQRCSEALVLPTGEETEFSVRWKHRILDDGLIVTLWHPLPAGYIDSTSLREALSMPMPSVATFKTIAFHPLLRYNELSWDAFHMTVIGQSSQAVMWLLRSGCMCALDSTAAMTLTTALIDLDQYSIASGLTSVTSEMIMRIRAHPRNQEIAVFGDMSAVMNLLPLTLTMNSIVCLQARADRKLGATNPAALERAMEAYRKQETLEVVALEQLASFASALISEVQLRAMGLNQELFHALDDHFGFTSIFHAACKLGRLWNAAERFAMMRISGDSAEDIFEYGKTIFHPGTAEFKWKLSDNFNDLPPLNLTPDHIHVTFATKQYARAIGEAPDATVEHLQDALIKAEHAFDARRTHLGADCPPTLKAQGVLALIQQRLQQVG